MTLRDLYTLLKILRCKFNHVALTKLCFNLTWQKNIESVSNQLKTNYLATEGISFFKLKKLLQ